MNFTAYSKGETNINHQTAGATLRHTFILRWDVMALWLRRLLSTVRSWVRLSLWPSRRDLGQVLYLHMETAPGASKRYPFEIEEGQPHSKSKNMPTFQKKINILGHVIEGGCLKPDPEKVEAIANTPRQKLSGK